MSTNSICDDERLINLIVSQPCLYDKSNREYRDIYKKENVWEFIASSLFTSKEQVKMRWTSLRQRFSREKSLINGESRSGAKGGHKPRWPLYELLRFLENHVTSRRTISNIRHEENEIDHYSMSAFEELPEDDMTFTPNITPTDLSVLRTSDPLEIFVERDDRIAASRTPVGSCGSASSRESEFPTRLANKTFMLSSTSSSGEVAAGPSFQHTQKGNKNSNSSTPRRRKDDQSVDDSITAVQEAITSWKEGIANKSEKNPEAPFGDFIAKELSDFKNIRNKDKVKGKICELIFQYKHMENDV